MEVLQLPVLLNALSASVLVVVAAFAIRHRLEPGAVPFALLMASLAIWAGGYAVALTTHDVWWRLFWEDVQWLGTSLHLWLFLFALEYTGHDRFVNRRTLALLLVFPVASVLAFWTNPAHHLMYTDATVVVTDGLALVDYSYGVGFWVHTAYTYALILVSFALLARLIFVSEYLYADQSLLLGAGIVIPLIINVLDIVFLESTLVVDITPLAFAITGLCFGYALFRRQLFDLVPATRHLGRQEAIGHLDTGIVIVDTDNRVVYANSAAGEVLDCEPAAAIGREAGSFVDEAWLDFDAEDALAEVEREDRTYEIRTSTITDRHGREIGHTLVFHDVTARIRRERELATVNDLNAVIRGVNQALVSATSREDIERAVCERLAASGLYAGACVADVPTWTGAADRWRVAGAALASDVGDVNPPDSGDVTPPDVDGEHIRAAGQGPEGGAALPAPVAPDDQGDWIVVPVVYGRTVYGAIGLYTERTTVSDRERAVLAELGELVGHAINGTESRRLFATEGAVELTVAVDDAEDPLAAATTSGDARLDVVGLVPGSGEGHHAFLEVVDGEAATVRDRLTAAGVDARVVREDAPGGLVDVVVGATTSLGPLVERDARLVDGSVAEGTATYEVLVPTAEEGRTLVDRLSEAFPGTDLRAKREREHPFESVDGMTPERLEALTDRQREALEAAYRAGYFEWPRDADAEAVAASMDISSPTLHNHLRKAQDALFTDLFDERSGGD